MRRRLLSGLLASIGVNAALGIYALVVPHFGDLQRRVLLTSVCVTAAGIVALACLPAWERRRLLPLPAVSVAVSAAGLALGIGLIWGEPGAAAPKKAMATLLVLGGAGALSCLLALARLAHRFRWVLAFAIGLVVLLALLWVAALWAEWEDPPSWLLRMYGVVAVLVAALVVAVPVLHRASARGTPERAVSFCPACGHPLSARVDEAVVCADCGASFLVRHVERPVARLAVEALPREDSRAASSGQA